MLKLKLSEFPPPHACLLAYYHGARFDADSNVGFDDTSWEWSENRTGFEQLVKVHRTGTPNDKVGSAHIVVGNVSARRRNLVDPVPLPWGNRLGGETRFRKELLVYNPIADVFDPDPGGDDEGEQAVAELKRGIEVLNIDGTAADDVIWDLGLVPDVGIPDDGRVTLGAFFAWRVFLYIDRLTTADRPLLVRYNAVETVLVNAELVIRYGHEELLRPEQYLNGTVVEPGSGIPAADDFILEINDDATFSLVDDGVVSQSMGLALWTDLADRGFSVESAGTDIDLVLWNTAPATDVEIGRIQDIKQRSIRETVQEVNKLNLSIKATALIEYPSAELDLVGTVTPITSIGSDALLMESHLFAFYFNESKIYMEKPTDIHGYEDWFAKIVASPLRTIISTGALAGYTLTYLAGEHTWQPFSEHYETALYGEDYLESIDEPAGFLTGKYITVRNRDFLPESLRVLSGGHDITSAIEDYDEEAGVIKMNKNILDGDRITVRYAYRTDWDTTIDSINLNPRQLHLPDGYRLYLGFYILPSIRVAPGGAVSTFAPNIGYVIANSVEEIVIAISGLIDIASGLPAAAQLIGVFQTNSQGEIEQVKILDARTVGGGLKDGIKLKDIVADVAEARFFSDLGYWDGEPYAGHGVIIVQVPTTVLGHDTTPVVNPPDGGFVDTTGRQDPADVKKRVDKHLTIGMTSVVDTK